MKIPLLLAPNDNDTPFPDVNRALKEPDGLLAVGGNLSTERLLQAYRHGIFPWFSPDDPILWWSPDPRLVLIPEKLHVSRSLKKTIKQNTFSLTCNTAFEQVIDACSEPRTHEPGTWITPAMKRAYITLHKQGYAHSFEAWQENRLVGGLYGIRLDRVFFGESMFARVSNASKVCFVYAVEEMLKQNIALIDCQVKTEHLQSLGATEITRSAFCRQLDKLIQKMQPFHFSDLK